MGVVEGVEALIEEEEEDGVGDTHMETTTIKGFLDSITRRITTLCMRDTTKDMEVVEVLDITRDTQGMVSIRDITVAVLVVGVEVVEKATSKAVSVVSLS